MGYSPNTNDQLQLQTVTVGGHEVTRNCQVNVGMIAGAYDETHRHFYTDDATKSNWYTGSEDAQLEMWYTLDDVAQASTVVGPFVGTSVADNAALSVAIGFFAIWKVNGLFVPSLPYVRFLPFQTWWLTVIFIALLALGSAILLAVFWWRCKKAGNFDSLKALNAGMKVSAILKTILLAVVLLAFAYFTLMLSEYLFNQDYRLWMAAFTEMKVEYWQYIWRYAIIMLPCFLLIGATTNYVIRKDIPAWADTLIAVLMNSAGIWLCCLVNYEIMVRTGNPWNSFISTYQVLLIAPITVYITRKLYRLTNSIWLGAAVNALLISWSLCSANGFDINAFIPQSAMSVFFNV